MALDYEDLLRYLNDSTKEGFFNSSAVEQAYVRWVKECKVSKALLQKLSQEHALLLQMSRNKRALPLPSFSEYVPVNGRTTVVHFAN